MYSGFFCQGGYGAHVLTDGFASTDQLDTDVSADIFVEKQHKKRSARHYLMVSRNISLPFESDAELLDFARHNKRRSRNTAVLPRQHALHEGKGDESPALIPRGMHAVVEAMPFSFAFEYIWRVKQVGICSNGTPCSRPQRNGSTFCCSSRTGDTREYRDMIFSVSGGGGGGEHPGRFSSPDEGSKNTTNHAPRSDVRILENGVISTGCHWLPMARDSLLESCVGGRLFTVFRRLASARNSRGRFVSGGSQKAVLESRMYGRGSRVAAC